MNTAEKTELLTIEEYLEAERRNEVRHEYLAGVVYAMTGAGEEHNIIALNLAVALRARLAGQPCRVFISDMKLRVRAAHDEAFYYPDVMVACDSRDADRYFKRFPRVIVEVLSRESERTDRREKFLSYTGIESLDEYVLVAQDRREVTVFRRATDWNPEAITAPDARLTLGSLDFSTPLSAVYQGVGI